MAKNFTEIPRNYAPGKPHSINFEAAKEEWDNRIGNARVQAYNWRLVSFGLLICLAISIFGLIYQSQKATVRPYVVQVSDNGMARAVGMADEGRYVPKNPEVKYFLQEWIIAARGVPSDVVVASRNYKWIYSFLSNKATGEVNLMMQKDDPRQILGKETRQVEIQAVLPVNEQTYQVRWVETTFDISGKITQQANYTGNISTSFAELKTPEELRANPLGLIIDDIYIQRDYKTN
ncbi:MAG: conjugal transfer protein TrbF [Bacillota bacterium]